MQDEELPQVFFRTIRQSAKIRNAFSNNISTYIELCKAQTSKINQSGGSFGSWLGSLGKRALINVAIPLARDSLPKLVINLASNAINTFEKINGKGAFRARKRFALFILNEDMNDIIKIVKPSEDWNLSIDGITQTVKHEIKKQVGRFFLAFLALLVASLLQPVIPTVVKDISCRGVRRAERGYVPSFKQYRDYSIF